MQIIQMPDKCMKKSEKRTGQVVHLLWKFLHFIPLSNAAKQMELKAQMNTVLLPLLRTELKTTKPKLITLKWIYLILLVPTVPPVVMLVMLSNSAYYFIW